MSFLGMGTLEVLIVLLVAFIFLGPERMVDAGRMLGKALGEVRRLTAELPDLTLDEESVDPLESPIVHRGGGPGPRRSNAPQEAQGPSAIASPPEDEGRPVAFQRPALPEKGDEAEPENREART